MAGKDYAARKAAGLCIQCGEMSDGKIRCPSCRERNKLARAVRRIKRKQDGLCTECKTPVKEEGYTLCADCREVRAASTSARYNRYKLANKCRICGKDSGGEARCHEHKLKYQEWRRTQTTEPFDNEQTEDINKDVTE